LGSRQFHALANRAADQVFRLNPRYFKGLQSISKQKIPIPPIRRASFRRPQLQPGDFTIRKIDFWYRNGKQMVNQAVDDPTSRFAFIDVHSRLSLGSMNT
jgi:hypothetical protein